MLSIALKPWCPGAAGLSGRERKRERDRPGGDGLAGYECTGRSENKTSLITESVASS
jgi:hypothetical protein